ncbi:nitrilase/amidohydrolase superfamily protein, class 5 [Syntrophotalea carbinolica DSM 2380]|uniref:Nitrilase/amidohydrolase superfamily protein, class 5 n=1 Tax=Syntrophotalea carbinolica (strain DSM 2380 / NBRC 103641 / GraBd1) TaxID=338963 RepID=Q3A8B7_SYNC1|nr:carbon-nitrogen family hydrolase [Syntrophotalea carbinolica]ABA87375.1 nitrilase/amidohydrolase superfamily protein, class 5 [Syntrophotalea carbinolica DSM 2380]
MSDKTGEATQQLTAGCLQFNIAMGDVEGNLQKVRDGLQALARQGGRLAVLPEMWSCGFDYRNLATLAAHTPQVVETVAALSARHDMVVIGSLPELDGDALYNTSYLVDRGVVRGRYRKLHLFSPMREDRYLQAGSKTLVADTSVGRIGLAICYDLRFPELFRRLTLDGADVICLSAQWPKPRRDHWCVLTRARAIENQVFVLAANCCGVQGKLDFFGSSMILSPRGEVLAEAKDQPCEVLATLDKQAQRDYRAAIPAWHDRRPDVYGVLT